MGRGVEPLGAYLTELRSATPYGKADSDPPHPDRATSLTPPPLTYKLFFAKNICKFENLIVFLQQI